jgi:glycosyltransferase involved in cell wall biosynthesis
VVIPSYNRPRFLIQAIKNVTEQTYKDLEIIVVDSSDDNTKELIQPYRSMITYIFQPRQGRSAAKNLGILSGSGEYIAFIDCDDLWYPSKIEKQSEILDSHPEVGFVYTNQLKEGPQGQYYIRTHPSKIVSGSIHKAILTKAVYASTSCLMIRKKCIEIAGLFDSSLSEQEDWDFPLRLSRYFKGYGIREPLTIKRLRGDETADREFELMRVRAMKKVFLRESTGVTLRSTLALNSVASRFHFYWGRLFLRNQKLSEARREFLLSWSRAPWRLYPIAFFLTALSGHRPSWASARFSEGLSGKKPKILRKHLPADSRQFPDKWTSDNNPKDS